MTSAGIYWKNGSGFCLVTQQENVNKLGHFVAMNVLQE